MRIIPIMNPQGNPNTQITQGQNQKKKPSFKMIYHIKTTGNSATKWLEGIADTIEKLKEAIPIKELLGRMTIDCTGDTGNGQLVVQMEEALVNSNLKLLKLFETIKAYMQKNPNSVIMNQIHTGSAAVETNEVFKLAEEIQGSSSSCLFTPNLVGQVKI